MIDEKTALAEELNKYIKLEKTQEECTGFIDGFEKALEVVKNLNIDFVSGSLPTDDDIDNLTCEEMDEREVYPPDYYIGFTNGVYWMKGKIIPNDH